MPSDLQLVQEYVLHLRVERGLSTNTISAYRSDLLQFSEFLSGKEVTLFAADKQHVALFLQHLANHEIEKRSRARKISALRRFYRWLILTERLERDPMRLTVSPKLDRLLPHPVEPEYLDAMLQRSGASAAVAASPLAIRDHAMLEVLYGGGLRVSELCSLRESDVSLSTGVARVLGKGSKERIVPLGDGAIAALEIYLQTGRPQLVRNHRRGKSGGMQRSLFLSTGGRTISRKRVYQIVVRQAGSDKPGNARHVHPHSLRHSCATDMITAGADLRAVQEQLGHGSIATTQIYTKVSPGHLQDTHAKFHPRGAVSKQRR